MGVWTRVLVRCEKLFNCGVKNNYSAFQNGLIYKFITSSCLTMMIENMKGSSLKYWKSPSFPYKTSFWENWFWITLYIQKRNI